MDKYFKVSFSLPTLLWNANPQSQAQAGSMGLKGMLRKNEEGIGTLNGLIKLLTSYILGLVLTKSVCWCLESLTGSKPHGQRGLLYTYSKSESWRAPGSSPVKMFRLWDM